MFRPAARSLGHLSECRTKAPSSVLHVTFGEAAGSVQAPRTSFRSWTWRSQAATLRYCWLKYSKHVTWPATGVEVTEVVGIAVVVPDVVGDVDSGSKSATASLVAVTTLPSPLARATFSGDSAMELDSSPSTTARARASAAESLDSPNRTYTTASSTYSAAARAWRRVVERVTHSTTAPTRSVRLMPVLSVIRRTRARTTDALLRATNASRTSRAGGAPAVPAVAPVGAKGSANTSARPESTSPPSAGCTVHCRKEPDWCSMMARLRTSMSVAQDSEAAIRNPFGEHENVNSSAAANEKIPSPLFRSDAAGVHAAADAARIIGVPALPALPASHEKGPAPPLPHRPTNAFTRTATAWHCSSSRAARAPAVSAAPAAVSMVM